MDQEELQKNIAEYYSRLPEDIQKKFSSMAWLETLERISAKYSLNDEQIQILGTETTLALLGVLHLGEYAQILIKELNLKDEVLQNLLADINDEIFREIAPKLNETFHKNNEELKKEENVSSPELEKKLEKLPEYVKEAVSASNYGETLFKIAKVNGLSITETGDLEKITTDLINGKILPDAFKNSIKATLGIDENKASKIVNEINEEILKKIRENMISATTTSQEIMEKNMDNFPKEDDILKNTGIEILQNTPELKSGNISQIKLTESFKIPSTKTDYSLKNIQSSSVNDTTAPVKKVDPYREIPE